MNQEIFTLDPPKSPLLRGTLNGSVPSLLRRVREDQQVLKHSLASPIVSLADFFEREKVMSSNVLNIPIIPIKLHPDRSPRLVSHHSNQKQSFSYNISNPAISLTINTDPP
jgi:hypothetical protein